MGDSKHEFSTINKYYPPPPRKNVVTVHPYLPITATSLQRREGFHCIACSRLSDSREDAKVKGTRKVGGAGKRKKEAAALLPPVFFLCSRFLNSGEPIISEPGTG